MTNTLVWKSSECGQRAVIKDGKVFTAGSASYSGTNCYFLVYNLKTGEKLEQSPAFGLEGRSNTAPVLNGNMVYGCAERGNIVAWNRSNNAIKWETTGLSVKSNKIEFDGRYLYIITDDNQLKKIDALDGSVTETFDLGAGVYTGDYTNARARYTGCAMHPYLDEKNNVLFAVGDSKLYEIDSANLTEIWSKDIGHGAVGDNVRNNRAGPIVVEDSHTNNEAYVIFGHRGNKKFYAYDYDGNRRWEANITEGVRAIASYNPNVGYLYIPAFLGTHSGSNKIYVLDVSDGTEKFTITGPRELAGSRPCTIADNYLIFKTTTEMGLEDYIYIYNAINGDFITEIHAGKPRFECYPIAVSEGYLVTGWDHTYCWKVGEGNAVDYYPLYGPKKYGYVERALLLSK